MTTTPDKVMIKIICFPFFHKILFKSISCCSRHLEYSINTKL